MYKQTLWYEIYSGRKIKWDSFLQYFDKNGDDESWYIYYVEENDEPRFELHAHIDGDTVIRVEPFKADVYGGHGRPIIDEKSLTAAEKKYAISIFEECFYNRVGETYLDIVDKAIAARVEFADFRIFKAGADGVVFVTPDNKKTKASYKTIINLLDYSHLDLVVVRDHEAICEFAKCFGIKNYEPLAAIMLMVDPTGYPEYTELERKYRYKKMGNAVLSGDIELCGKYIDVLQNPKNNVQAFCETAVKQDNKQLLAWLIDHISGVPCDLSAVLGMAVRKNNDDLFYYLLDSGLVDAKHSDSKKWDAPMYIAAYDKGHEKYVMPLLQRGFSLAAGTAYRLYSTYSLDELAALLPYKVEFDQNTINRIYAENRSDIITALETPPMKYCTVDALFVAYVHCGDFVKFAALLESGYRNNSHELFAAAYKNSPAWTDLWLQHEFDINCDDARLLHKACEDLLVDFAIYLLEHGANPHLKGKYSQTVFEKAGGFHGYLDEDGQREKERLCKYLLEHGLNPIKESRRAPSILTYLMGKTDEFDRFLIDWLAANNCLNTPDLPSEVDDTKHLPIAHILDVVFERDFKPHIMRYCIEKGAITNAEGITDDKIFIKACRLCGLEDLKLVVSAGANIYEQDRYYGTNGLYEAIQNKRTYDIIEYLIQLGLNVNSVRNAFRNTKTANPKYPPTSVLDIAEQNGDDQIVKLLKSAGAMHANEILLDV